LNRSPLLICLAITVGIAVLATTLQGPALWDVRAIAAFQGNGTLKPVMEAVTTLGSQGFLLILVLLVFWCVNKPLGIDMALLLVITGAANVTLKTLLQSPRPFWSDSALHLTSAESFSTPSGHAAHATVLFGYLAWWLVAGRPQEERPQGSRLQGLVAALLLLCIYLVSLSRVYLGVHFPGDVIWGCAEGIAVLVAYIGLRPRLAIWLREVSLGTNVALAAGAAAGVLVLNLLFLVPQHRPPLAAEADFMYTQAHAQAVNEAGNLAGLVLGTWIGLALERRVVRFMTAGSVRQRILRYSLGLAGLLAIGLGLPLVFPEEPRTLDLALGVAGVAAAALWAVFAWPWLFVRTGLAEAEHRISQVGSPGN
jgi:membrane-associated phospholipid phosphatase